MVVDAEGQAGGQQPAGRQGAVEVAAFLPAPDDLEQPVEDRAVPAGVLVRADRGQVPEERVAGGHLPAGVQQPDQRPAGGASSSPAASKAAVTSAVARSTTASSSASREGKWA